MDKVRSYEYNIKYLNIDKKKYIEDVIYPEWKKIAKILINKHVEYFYKNSELCKNTSLYKPIVTFLSERYKDVINRQILGMMKSKLSNFKNRFNKIVSTLNLSTNDKKDLSIVCKYNLFFKKADTKLANYTVSLEKIRLARWVFKHFIGKMPSIKGINMVMQDKICGIQNSLLDTNFQYFLKLNKGDKNIPIKDRFIYIPLNNNKYADSKDGELSTSCTLCFKQGKLIKIILSKKSTIVNKKKTGVTIGFDIGLNILLALDNGETYGMHFMRYLKRVDKQIINLQNSLKKEYGKHVKLKEFKEYNNLIRRRKARIKNEINRLLNKIVNKHDIDTITLESLDFRGSKLARKVNRLLTNFGMSQLKNKLQSLKEDKGIKISYTDAAYTSQTCSNINCGYIDKKNRKSQKEFKCKFCGKKLNADVNGSRIVKKFNERFGEKRFYTHVDRSNKRTLIVNDFIDSEVWVNSSRRAIQELVDNDYFSSYMPFLREKLEHLS